MGCPRRALRAALANTGLSPAQTEELLSHVTAGDMVQHADFIAAAASYSEHLRTAASLEAKAKAQAKADAKSRAEAEGTTTVGRFGGSLAISGAAVKMPAG